MLSSTSSAGFPSLLCSVGPHLCALPLVHVVETMRPLPIVAIAGTPPFVLGMAVIRGGPVPVFSVSAVVGASSAPPGRFVTIRVEARVVALAVDAVEGVATLDPSTLADVPPLLREASREVLQSVGALDARLVVVLRTARLLPSLGPAS